MLRSKISLSHNDDNRDLLLSSSNFNILLFLSEWSRVNPTCVLKIYLIRSAHLSPHGLS